MWLNQNMGRGKREGGKREGVNRNQSLQKALKCHITNGMHIARLEGV